MGLFRAIVGVVIETATLPLAVAADIITLGDVGGTEGTFTSRKIEKIKDEASEADKSGEVR
jgi:hypothetical protein